MSEPTDFDILQAELAEKGVKYLLPSYVDIHGASKSKLVPIAHLKRMMNGSELCTGAALDGVPQVISDDEVGAHPDPASCMIQPWQPEVAWFASDLWCAGKPFEPCSRNILKRVLAEAEAMGYKINLGMEAEFFVLREGEDGEVLPVSTRHNLAKPAYDVPRALENMGWLSETVDAMNELGWDVYSFDHEDGIGQFEIDFAFSDALTTADRFVFFRRMADAIARKHGAFATFMPKPFGNYAGSGAHFNISIADAKTGKNLCVPEGEDPRGCDISEISYQFVAGMLKHLPTLSAVVAPTVNSYKRLILKGSNSGFTWAPVFQCYGNNNRTNTIRIPGGGGRMELRLVDPMCNPYLAAALTIAAGLEGIREKADPGNPHFENMYEKTPKELEALGVKTLPRTLEEALDAFEGSALANSVFGDRMFASWLEYKRGEWLSYLNHVSDWEVKRYMQFY
ncbi:type III glutamate--ammonia ligase [Albirhodobacter sp. R86504]|uniref:type III glutamate--ammonia ligase n=1 Tax=Albirhodobacter sp. R86504 TaxID=3093848 RepID=UPI00366BFE5C